MTKKGVRKLLSFMTVLTLALPGAGMSVLAAGYASVVIAPGNIDKIVGTGALGFSGDGGLATGAQLNWPEGIAVDSSNNLYIADSSNRRVRKVDYATGNISTIAGIGSPGYTGDNGAATMAELDFPVAVAVDSSDNVYVSDTDSCCIRKIDAVSGIITTVAGNGVLGYSGDGGAATGAQLKTPYGIAVDNSGNLYIADSGSNRIRKVDGATGIISTIAGDGSYGYSGDGGQAINAQLNSPDAVAVDSSGNIYFSEDGNYTIRKIAPNGIITTIAGNGAYNPAVDDTLATSGSLAGVYGIVVNPSGNVCFTEGPSHRVYKIDADGYLRRIAGDSGQASGYAGNGGAALSATLNYPYGIACDSDGNYLFSEYYNHVVRMVIATVKINYNANGSDTGSAPADNTAYILGDSTTVLTNTGSLAKSGYNFAGWNTKADGTGTNYAEGATISLGNSDVTLYAKWAGLSCTFTFNSNGGSSVGNETVNYNTAASAPTVPTKEHYDFAGWYSDSGLTAAYDFTQPVTVNKTLYAKWTPKNYTVSFDTSGGGTVSSQAAAYNTAVAEPAVPAKEHYTFAGWYSDSGLTTAYNFADPITADTIIYAKWSPNQYTVSFDSNGGSAVASQSAAYNTATAVPGEPVKVGLTFAGWYTDSALTSVYNFSNVITGDTTVYAKWISKTYLPLKLKVKGAATSQKISFKKIAGADGYILYGARAGKSLTKIAEISKNQTAYTVKSLKKNKNYKYQLKAYSYINGQKIIVSVSLPVHSRTISSSIGNPTSVNAKQASVTLSAGKTVSLKCKSVNAQGLHMTNYTKKISYITSNEAVAVVNSNGVVTASGKGSCTIYACAQNGMVKKIKITVN